MLEDKVMEKTNEVSGAEFTAEEKSNEPCCLCPVHLHPGPGSAVPGPRGDWRHLGRVLWNDAVAAPLR